MPGIFFRKSYRILSESVRGDWFDAFVKTGTSQLRCTVSLSRHMSGLSLQKVYGRPTRTSLMGQFQETPSTFYFSKVQGNVGADGPRRYILNPSHKHTQTRFGRVLFCCNGESGIQPFWPKIMKKLKASTSETETLGRISSWLGGDFSFWGDGRQKHCGFPLGLLDSL